MPITQKGRKLKVRPDNLADGCGSETQWFGPKSVGEVAGRPVRPKINWRCWCTSFLAHLILLTVLASIFLGNQRTPTVVLHSESVVDPELQEINFTLATFEKTGQPINETISVDRTESTDLSIEVDFGIEPIGVVEPFEELGDEILDYDPRPGKVESIPEITETNRLAGAIQKRVVQAGGKSGEVQFSLSWDAISDLDLHVITPSGERMWFSHRRSNCNGMLDVDRNASRRRLTTSPIENIRWLKDRPKSGRYTVLVHCFQYRTPREKPVVEQPVVVKPGAIFYHLLAKTGEDLDVKNEFAENNSLHIYRYVYFSPSIKPEQREIRLAELKKIHAEEEIAAVRLIAAIRQPIGSNNYYRALDRVIQKYPHTDAAIELLKIMPGRGK